jgi:hypothetical protein
MKDREIREIRELFYGALVFFLCVLLFCVSSLVGLIPFLPHLPKCNDCDVLRAGDVARSWMHLPAEIQNGGQSTVPRAEGDFQHDGSRQGSHRAWSLAAIDNNTASAQGPPD